MKHFLIFNYDFPKYVRLDVGNETRMHLDKQGRYLLQPNRINGRVYYEQITGWSHFILYKLCCGNHMEIYVLTLELF